MLIVPLQPLPNQLVTVTLSEQVCKIAVYQKEQGLFLDLTVDNVTLLAGVICENLNRIVRSIYIGFSGDLAFIDNQGSNDPEYTGLGSRWSLAYLTEAELLL